MFGVAMIAVAVKGCGFLVTTKKVLAVKIDGIHGAIIIATALYHYTTMPLYSTRIHDH